MKIPQLKQPRALNKAFTLVEIMIATFLFAIVAGGITAMVVQSQKIAQTNVIKNVAYATAESYLEQIKELPRSMIESALANPSTVPLPVTTISTSTLGQVDTTDTLYLNQANQKNILLAIDDTDPSNLKPLTVSITLTPTIVDLNDPSYGPNAISAFMIQIDFTYEARHLRGIATQSGSVRALTTDI